MFRTFATAAILALTVTAAQAGTVTVRFDDLNVSSPADAKVLAGRIQSAAAEVCAMDTSYGGPRHNFYPVFYQASIDQCVRQVSLNTMERITASLAERPRFASN